MKKIYLLAVTAICFAFTANAQWSSDGWEFFDLGDAAGQVPEVVLWPAAGVTSSQVTDTQAFEGDKSVVTRPQAGGNVDDILVNVGNKSTGQWTAEWMMYVPAGATGFWNIQNDETFMATSEAQWNGQFFVGATASGGNAGEITWDQDSQSVPYPEDQWFKVSHQIDMDAGTHTCVIDGNVLLDAVPYNETQGAPADMIGAINYFAIDGNNEYYVDNFEFFEGFLNTSEFDETTVSVYPNPVQDILNISTQTNVESVVVYDVLGKVVLNVQPDAISPSVNVSALSSGAYMVQITTERGTKTVKVVK